MSLAVRAASAEEQISSARLFSGPDLARLEVLHTMTAAEPSWRWLENGPALSTPYQRFELLAAWQRHVGTRSGVEPAIVVGFDPQGQPLFVWPFGRMRKGPLTIMGFLGSKHANFNLPLWRRDFLASTGKD